jgi:hypothetical protein
MVERKAIRRAGERSCESNAVARQTWKRPSGADWPENIAEVRREEFAEIEG